MIFSFPGAFTTVVRCLENPRARHLSPSDAENRLSKRLYRSDPLLYRADELNSVLCLFLKEIREMYEGDSIYYLALGIQHYLRENRSLFSSRRSNEGHFYRTESIFFDPTFIQFQCKLHSILVRFCHNRDPSRPLSMRGATPANIDDRPSRIEEELLWEGKQLGAHTPWVLLNTILYFNTKYFFLKTVNEHQVLSFSNVRRHYKRNVGPHGEEYGRSVYLRSVTNEADREHRLRSRVRLDTILPRQPFTAWKNNN